MPGTGHVLTARMLPIGATQEYTTVSQRIEKKKQGEENRKEHDTPRISEIDFRVIRKADFGCKEGPDLWRLGIYKGQGSVARSPGPYLFPPSPV